MIRLPKTKRKYLAEIPQEVSYIINLANVEPQKWNGILVGSKNLQPNPPETEIKMHCERKRSVSTTKNARLEMLKVFLFSRSFDDGRDVQVCYGFYRWNCLTQSGM